MARSAEAIRKRKARKAARIRSRKVKRILDIVEDRDGKLFGMFEGPGRYNAQVRAIRDRLGCSHKEGCDLYREAKTRIEHKERMMLEAVERSHEQT